jgi:TetR/AcrR family transcriptional regulator
MVKQSPNRRNKPSSKRAAILAGATELFRQHGLRRTTIDDIAKAAQVAKPTVYAHYVDKEALYVEVVSATLAAILEDAKAAAKLPTLRDRIVGVLAAKFTRVFELLHQSPHASELVESNHALAADVIVRADDAYLDLVVDVVRKSKKALGTKADSPRAFATKLLQLGHGAGYHATTAREHRKNLENLVDLVL